MNNVKILKASTIYDLESQIKGFVKKGYFPRYESFRIVKDKRGNDIFYIFVDEFFRASVEDLFSLQGKRHLKQTHPRNR